MLTELLIDVVKQLSSLNDAIRKDIEIIEMYMSIFDVSIEDSCEIGVMHAENRLIIIRLSKLIKYYVNASENHNENTLSDERKNYLIQVAKNDIESIKQDARVIGSNIAHIKQALMNGTVRIGNRE